MNRTLCLVFAGCLGLICVTAHAQQELTVFNEYITQPDVWRPGKPLSPGVTAGGDLTMNLPVLTVPGRNGLDYTVALTYQSGIKLQQPSSWVGVGWRFDPGSITRDVQGLVLDGQQHTVDYARSPAYQPDTYYVTTPGGAFTMVRRNLALGLRPARGTPDGFYTLPWQPWHIAADSGSVSVTHNDTAYRTEVYRLNDTPSARARLDYVRFVLTDPGGVRYIFAHPTLGTYIGPHNVAENYSKEFFVDAWRLVAILGADYPGEALPGGDPGDPTFTSTPAKGSWIRFHYHTPLTTHAAQNTDGVGPARITQATYLDRIETPTHMAVFHTAEKPVESFAYPWVHNIHKQLDRITLYARGEAVPIREVALTYETEQPIPGIQSTRLTLAGLSFYGKNQTSLPGDYRFTYYPTSDGATLSADQTDDFGYYNAGPTLHTAHDDGKSWSLKTVRHPSGAVDTYLYENDVLGHATIPYIAFDAGTRETGSPGYTFGVANNRQGGARLKEMHRSDGLALPTVTRYAYGTGQASGVPERHWERGVLALTQDFFKPNTRGQSAVYYTHITRIYPDDTYARTYYTGPHHTGIEPLRTVLYKDGAYATLIQDNADINWGLVGQTEVGSYLNNVPVASRRTVRILTLGAQPLSLAFGQSAEDEVHILWRFGESLRYELIQERAGAGFETLLKRTYTRRPETDLLWRIQEEINQGVQTRVHDFTYAYEVYPDLDARNILSRVVREDAFGLRTEAVPDEPGQTRQVRRYFTARVTKMRAVYTGDDYIGDDPCTDPEAEAECVWHPDEVYRWRSPAPTETAPSFSTLFYAEGATPGADWALQARYRTYDPFGHLTELEDALGHRTQFYYGSTAAPCTQANDATLARSYLTCIRRGDLVRILHYYPDGTVAATEDSNGNRTPYQYDAHQRLLSVGNAVGDPVLAYTYVAGALDQNGLKTPHQVITRQPTGTGVELESVDFFDGLGQTLQTQVHEGEGIYVVRQSTYDALGRVVQTWKPYRHLTRGQFDPDALGRAYAAYGPDATPYRRTTYTPDGQGRIASVMPEHRGTTAPAVYNTYTLSTLDGTFYRRLDTQDENGFVTTSFSDGFGQPIKTIAGNGTPEAAQTAYAYDEIGRLIEIRPPNAFQAPPNAQAAWYTTYAYNTLGRRTQKTSPDAAGSFRYAYDALGRLRVVHEPRLAALGQVRYSRYDAFGRLLETGVAAGTIDAVTEAQLNDPAWPAHGTPTAQLVYDAYTGLNIPPGMPMAHPKEHLTQVTFEGGTYQFFYTPAGQVAATNVCLDDLGGDEGLPACKQVRYQYDRQGHLLELHYQPGAADQFLHWYTYDAAGRLYKVCTGQTPDAAPEGDCDAAPDRVREAVYTYTPAGLIAQLQLGADAEGAAVQTMAYTYHIRDWLTDINQLDQPGQAVFAMRLGYETLPPGGTGTPQYNGNVAWMGWQTTGNRSVDYGIEADQNRYTFAYDPLNRLVEADYHYAQNGTWHDGAAFDVGPLAYDGNGNMTRLQRARPLTQPGQPRPTDDWTYVYTSGTNRLKEIHPPGQPGTVEAGFTYDANGNLIAGRAGAAYTYTHDALPRTIDTPRLDAQGVPVGTDRTTYRYDAQGLRIYKRTDFHPTQGAVQTGTAVFFIRSTDGTILAVYEQPPGAPARLQHLNLVAGSTLLGRVEMPE